LNEPNDSEKGLFTLMNEFEQESHKHASQNRARQAFELIKLKLCFVFLFLNERSFHLIRPLFIIWCRLKPFEQFAVCTVGPWTVWFPLKSIIWRKILECFHQKP